MKIILVILLILLFVFVLSKKENYADSQSSNKDSDPLHSDLFNDVKLYAGDKTLDGELGLEKCIKECNGMCVEYGMTGDAYCFPKKDIQTIYTTSVSPELKNNL